MITVHNLIIDAILILIVAMAIVAIILFVKDGKQAKSEQRKREGAVTALFISAISVFVLLIILFVLPIVLSSLSMTAM